MSHVLEGNTLSLEEAGVHQYHGNEHKPGARDGQGRARLTEGVADQTIVVVRKRKR